MKDEAKAPESTQGVYKRLQAKREMKEEYNTFPHPFVS